MTSVRRHPPSVGRANMLVLLLGLLLSWQSLVVGTHHHDSFPVQTASAAAAANADTPAKKSPSDLPADCPICREIAHAGTALLPPSVAIEPPVFTAFWAAPPAPLGAATAPRSHRWRSRAPPAALPA